MLDDFFIRALLAGIGLAIVAGPLGCFIVWRRLAYFGETIAHSALLGVAFAILAELDLMIGIFAAASLVVVLVYTLERQELMPIDSLLGLLSHGALALGLLTLSFFPTFRIDLHGLLFGNILAVSKQDLLVIWLGGTIAIATLLWIWKPLVAATLNEELAAVSGLHPDRTKLIFGVLLAAVVAAAIKIVGVLLIVALLIIPAVTIRPFSASPESMAVRAAVTGLAAVVGGLYLSAQIDTPTGPSIVLIALLAFVLSRLAMTMFRARKPQNP